jgi:hypothetical protein
MWRHGLFGGVHLAEPESLCNRATHWSFAFQNPIDENAINAVASRKSGLTTFTLNCGPQQADNIILVKHKCMVAQIAGDQHILSRFGMARRRCRRRNSGLVVEKRCMI